MQVLRRLAMKPVPGLGLTVVLDRADAVYSGMVPGFVAGDYASHELEIDVVPLARRAGAAVILAPATAIDPVAHRVEVAGRPAVAYDVASLDVGSSVRGLEVPGVRDHAVATRPIRELVDRLDARIARAVESDAAPRVVVVGAGAAGFELACTLSARLRAAGAEPAVTLLGESPELLPGAASRVAARARREAERRGVQLRCGVRVAGVEKSAVRLDGGEERVASDLTVWATGAAPPALLGASRLPLDEAGYVRVRPTLQVVGHDDLFAVGDCASLERDPWVPKAGVYAVRQGPVLSANLRAWAGEGGRLRPYRPQRDFLSLLNLGAGEALGSKWGVAVAGRRVWRLKDWIDRRFMRRFQVLDAGGAPAPDFPTPEEMGMEEMACGGCAAKVGASPLSRALARLAPPPDDPSVLTGLERPDDAAALALPRGDVVLATVDAFRAFTDDPWLVGRVAAVNAASDVLAKGGRPRHALALVTVPEEDPARAEETLFQVLAGVRAALDEMGVSLVGGHSTQGEELFVGLSITGEVASAGDVLSLDGLRPGHRLLLTKPLGTGVLLAADMRGLAAGAWVAEATDSMLRSNADAARVAREVGASACTDVSGFGLAAHLGEMLRASDVSAAVDLATLPILSGVASLVARGVRSTFHEQNAEGRRGLAGSAAALASPVFELLFDPQTSGGLLFGVQPERADEALRALREAGDARAAVIGRVEERRGDGALFGVAQSV